jgi:hypothetical protein
VAVVYISVEPEKAGVVMDNEAMMARSVRMVRSMAREFDTVGRPSRDRLALIMADLPEGDALSARLSRLVALGLMYDSHETRDTAIRFRMSVGLRKAFAGSFAELEAALLALLQDEAGSDKAIHYLPDAVQHNYPR